MHSYKNIAATPAIMNSQTVSGSTRHTYALKVTGASVKVLQAMKTRIQQNLIRLRSNVVAAKHRWEAGRREVLRDMSC
jgi:hypothetical protein